MVRIVPLILTLFTIVGSLPAKCPSGDFASDLSRLLVEGGGLDSLRRL